LRSKINNNELLGTLGKKGREGGGWGLVGTFLFKKLSIIKFIFKTVFFTIGLYCQVLVHTWELIHNPIHTWARGQLGEQGGPGKASIHYYQLLNLRTILFSLKSPKES
jgi:hypothetical protein